MSSTDSSDARLHAIAYYRRSTDKQEESLEGQLDWSVRLAEQQGIHTDADREQLAHATENGLHEFGDVYWDDETGGNLDRPGLRALLGRVNKDSEVTHVLVWSRDRLSRSYEVYDALRNEDLILRAGKTILVADGPPIPPRDVVDNRLEQEIGAYVEYSQAASYRFKVARGALRGQSKNARQGYWNGGPVPHGMRRASFREDTGKLEWLTEGETKRASRKGTRLGVVVLPGEDDASRQALEVVRLIHRLYSEGFGGLKAIAKRLNELGYPSPNAGKTRKYGSDRRPVPGKWTAGSVRTILEQPAYIAKYVWGRRSQGSLLRYDPDAPDGARKTRFDELKADGKGKKLYSRDIETWELCDPAYPYEPVVDPEIWYANVRKLAERGEVGGQRGVPRKRDETKYPLRVICGDCSKPMSGCPYSGKLVYKCSTYLNSGSEACSHNWVDVEILVPFALEAVKQIVQKNGNRERLRVALREVYRSEYVPPIPAPDEATRLEAEITSLEAKRAAVFRDTYSEDKDRASDAQKLWEELKGEIADARRKLERCGEARSMPVPDLEEEVDAALAVVEDLHLLLGRVPKERLAEVFRALDVSVLVEFERKKVARRDIIPVHATVRIGSLEGLQERTLPQETDEKTLCGKDGRGEKI